VRRTALAIPLVAAAAQCAPAVTSVAPLRRALLHDLAGIAAGLHVALTYDDGPDPASTPAFLDLLERHARTATFFVLGAHVEQNRALVQRMSAEGHELAVHGWDHGCVARKRPGVLAGEVRRTAELLEDLTGAPVRWYRPPYGVLTTESAWAARRCGLRTVLWSAWGCDWSRRATPGSIHRMVTRSLRPGGTVLLHDTDRTAAPASWRNTLAASATLLDSWSEAAIPVGPLRDHW
jgi:peptidoglycan/xylan/chitin deacetylase (PgdA/CDA1 family)